MHEITYTDRSFDQYSAASCNLSIQVHHKGVSYCIADENVRNYIFFRKHRFTQVVMFSDLLRETERVLTADEILQLPFKSVKFLGYTQESTLIPEKFFDNSESEQYLKFNQSVEGNGILFNNLISSLGVHNIFSLPGEMVSLISAHFKNAEFLNQTTPFLRHIADVPDSLSKPCVFIGLNPDFFDIACMDNGELKIYNSYLYSSENDLLYYTLYVIDKMGMKPQDASLYVSGEYSTKGQFFEILSQYLPQTHYDELKAPALTPGLKELNAARFLNLLNLQLCESSAEHTGDEK